MKKIISVFLVCVMLLGLAACGGDTSELEAEIAVLSAQINELEGQISDLQNENQSLKNQVSQLESDKQSLMEQVNKTQDTTQQPEESPEPEGPIFTELFIGQTVELEFVSFTIEGAAWSDTIKPEDTSGAYIYKGDKENETYFWLCGSLKNISVESYDVTDMLAQLCFNDKYVYDAYITLDDGGNSLNNYSVRPLETVKFYIYVSAPDELKEIYEDCLVKFAFQENFDMAYRDDFETCSYVYSIMLVNEEEQPVEE